MAEDRATLSLVDIATPDLTLGGIKSVTFNPGTQDLVDGADGEVDPSDIAVGRSMPRVNFSTISLHSALGSIGIAGAECTNFDTYQQYLAGYGTREATLSHTKINLAKAFCVPRQITWSRGANAELSYDAHAISTDGETSPVTLTADQSIPSGAGATERYVFDELILSGSTVIECDGGQFDFGIQETIEGGTIYPVYASIMARNPVLTAQLPGAGQLASLGVIGSALTAGAITFRKRTTGGTFVETADVTIAWSKAKVSVDDWSGAHGGSAADRAVTNVTVRPYYDGTNPILTVTTE